MIALLEKAGELDNTIVVMSGDNRLPFPRCKATLYDTGIHVPLATRWGAKVKGGRDGKDFVTVCDLAPPFLEAGGLRPPVEITGKTLMPILMSEKFGQVDPTRNNVLTGMKRHVYLYPCRAIRTSDYLRILNFDPGNWPTGEGKWSSADKDFSFNIGASPSEQFMVEHQSDPGVKPLYALAFGRRPEEKLHDLREDTQQLRNVAHQEEYGKIKQDLRRQLEVELRASQDLRFASAGRKTKTRKNGLFSSASRS